MRLTIPLFSAFFLIIHGNESFAQSDEFLIASAKNKQPRNYLSNKNKDEAKKRVELTANVGKTTTKDKKLHSKIENRIKELDAVLRFEQNQGQLGNTNVRFIAKDAQATYFFSKDEIRTVIGSSKDSLQAGYALQFINANSEVILSASDKIDTKAGATNYITDGGSFANVAGYHKLSYSHLWDGVEASFYESEGSMKYDFIVQPNADPAQIRLKMDGASDLKINAKGELEFTTIFGTLQKGKPYTYQTVNGKKVEISSAYKLNNKGEITFQLGEYEHTLPLVIDPIALKWSTYLMAGLDKGTPYDIYVHPTTGRIYIVGYVSSTIFPNTLGRAYGGFEDAFVTCMEKDGTSLVWSTYIGGSSNERAYAVSVDAAGDIYVGGYTLSTDFPTNGTTAAFDATHNGDSDIFLLRLNNTGNTLKYSTFVGGSGAEGTQVWRKLVVNNGKVYVGSGSTNNDFPTTIGAYQQSISNISSKAVLFCLNTNVGGEAGLEFSTFFATPTANKRSQFTEIEEDKDGNLWLVGWTGFDPSFPISSNAVQTYESYRSTIITDVNFVAKFSKSGQYLYSSYVNPIWAFGDISWGTQHVPSLDLDAQGNVYVAASSFIKIQSGFFKKVLNTLAFNELSPLYDMLSNNFLYIGYVAKIPYDLSPQYDFVSIFPTNTLNDKADPEIAIDKKGNIHLFTPGGDDRYKVNHPLTAGALNTQFKSGGSVYYVLTPSGSSVLYGSVLNSGFSHTYFGMFVNDKCEAYLISQTSPGDIFPITPSYRDFDTNTKKTVYNSANNTHWGLAVFHEPIPNNNTIPNFVAGNNTFCVGSLIYQNPNDGPILGSTVNYVSGDGSSATHNIPNTVLGAHPTPASPALQYQWQKSLNGGSTWTNVGNGTFPVYKPEPEGASGTVKYRRLVVGFCCDTLTSSNIATATIATNFDLQITTPTKPVYYCPTVAGTDLGISVTGASGNISWQWYDGFSPLTGNGIITPSSGSGLAQGSFTAAIGTSVSASGFYRLVITDAGGCKKETFVAIAPKTANAGPSPTIALCPGGVISSTLGPSAINPDFDYSWTGPSGFASTSPNPTVTTAGTYILQVKLKTDASFCAPGTTVTVIATIPHNAALTSLANQAFCQGDSTAPIGLSSTTPSDYVFQWVPGTNLDNQQAYSPVYDPGVVPGGPPIGTTNYTFTALRLSDGCIFESTKTVTNTALAFAFAGSDLFGDGCTNGKRDGIGGVETTGLYFQWTAVNTDFAAGLASLKANAAFGMDVVGQQVGTNKFLNAKFPLCSANGNKGYYIDYELRASYIPFTNNCFKLDTVRVFIPCCGYSSACPIISSNSQGKTGACSGATTELSFSPIQGATYTWTTYSIDGVIQPAGTAPKGLFVNNDGVKGAAIAATGSHPSSVIVDFDDATWGWLGKNVVVYEVMQTIDLGYGPQTCISRQQVFSGLNGRPKIGVVDQALCSIVSPGIRVGTTGKSAPYDLTGASFTQAPNSDFDWSWTGGPITSGANTPFPTINPTTTTNYYVTVKDVATGCEAKDTLVVKLKSVIANAGANLTDICPGSLVQLGTPAELGHSYSWSPSAGLNFPIGTPNSTTAQPYLSVPNVPTPPATLTYTLNVTDSETGCAATDNMTIGTTNNAPPEIGGDLYSACPNTAIMIGPSTSETAAGSTFAWTLVSGGNISYLSSTVVRQPFVMLPANFTGPAIFRLTSTKGTCGSVTADFTINNDNPTITLGGPFTATCTSPYTQIGEGSATGYTYSWIPYSGLFTDAALTKPYTGESLSQVYALPTASTTYTLTRTHTTSGCQQTATVVVNPPAGVAVNAGADKFWCSGAGSVAIGSTGSGTLSWTAIGYSASLSSAVPTTIASPMTSTQMLGYLSSTSGASVNFSQSSVVSGQYVYRVTSTSGGCSISDDVIVKVGAILPTGIAGLSQAVCLGESVQIGATTNPKTFNYFWTALNPISAGNTINSSSIARPFVTPTVNTTYQVTYTDAATGCSADEQVSVVVNPKPFIADVTVPIVCKRIVAQNLTTLITGYSSLVKPVWYQDQYPGGVVIATPTSVAISKTTTYYLVAENALGCKDTAKVVINIANPTPPDITPSGSLNCATHTFDLTTVQGSPSVAGNTLEWHSKNNTLAGTLLTNTTVGIGKYYLFEKAASPANCYSASDSITISSNCPVGSLGDYVWKDANNNGIQDVGELGVKGVIVQLLQGTTVVSTDTTDAAGLYLFPNLSSGKYQVKILTASLPAGYLLSTKENQGTDDTKDSDFDSMTGLSQTVTIDALGTGIAKDNLTIDAALFIPCTKPNAGADAVVCQPISTAKLTAISTGGTWSAQTGNPSTANIDASTGSITGLSAAGTYKFIYSVSSGGQTCTDTAQVVVNAKPNIANGVATICSGISLDLTSKITGYSSLQNPVWTLSTASGTAVSTPTAIKPSASTTYVLVAQNSMGCKDTANVVVTVNAKPSAGTDQILVCSNPTTNTLTTATTLAPSPTGGTWLQIGTSPATASITGNNVTGMNIAGSYQFEYSLNGCKDTVAVTVSPCAGCVKPNAGADAAVCQPISTAKLTAISTGGTWSAQTGNPSTANIDASTGAITGLSAAGMYKFIYSVSSGGQTCTDTAQVVVNAKPNIANGVATICAGLSVDLTSRITGYTSLQNPVWTLSTASGTAVSTPTAIKPSASTTYVLVAQNSMGCKDTANVVVTVNAKPSAGTDQTLACSNPTTNTLTTATTLAPSPTGGTWLQIGTSPATASITGNNVTGMNIAGSYQFEYSLNGCKDTVAVTVSPCAGCVKPNAGADAAVCQPISTAKLTAISTGGTWSAQTGNPSTANIDASTGAITGLSAAGMYKFIYSVSSGGQTCTDTAQVVVNAKPNIANGVATICSGLSLDLTSKITGYSSLQNPVWTLSTATGTAVSTPTAIKPSANTTFVLVAQNAMGCKDTSNVVVTVNSKPNAGTDQILVCSNPTTNTLTTATTLAPSPTGGTWLQIGTSPATASITGNNVTGMNIAGSYQFEYSLNGCKDTVAVTVSPCAGCVKPNAGADAAAVCQPTSTAKLTAISTGGTWSAQTGNPSTANIDASTGAITGLSAAGTYKFIYSVSSGGQTCTDTAQVVVNAKPNIANGVATICAGLSVDLTSRITGYTSLQNPVWTLNTATGTAVSTPTAIKPSSSTTYVLVAQNAMGCKDTANVAVTANAKPSAGTDQSLACSNPTANTLTTATTLVPSPTGGTWLQIGTTPATASITGNNVTGMSIAGSYQFEYSLNGCKDTVAVTVSPCAGCVKPNAGADAVVCQPTSAAKLTAISTGGTWSAQTGNPSTAIIDASTGSITGLSAAGTYKFIYSVSSGGQTCTDTAQVVVNAKPNIANGVATICSGLSVDLTSKITGYASLQSPVWTLSTATGTAVSTPTAIKPSSSTTYVLVAQNAMGCKDTANVVVTVNAKPSAGTDQTLACSNPTANTLTTATTLVPSSTGGTWLQIGTTPATASITGNNVTGMNIAGSYQFEYTLNGCKDTVAVTVSPCAGCVKPNAGADQILICSTAGIAPSTATLAPVTSGGTWIAQTGNPATATVSVNDVLGMTVSGVYKFIYSVTSGGQTCTDTVQIIVPVCNVPKGSIGDFVWKDANNNGIQDETTAYGGGVANVIVELYKNGTLLTKDTTDATGKYLFTNLDAGTYKIKIVSTTLPAGYEISSVPNAGTDDTKDSDVDKTTGFSGDYVIDPIDPTKKDFLTVDAGLISTTPKVDLALIATINGNCKRQIGDTLTIRLVLKRQDLENITVTGISVKDSIAANLQILTASTSKGSFDSNSNIWSGITLAQGDSAVLKIKVKITNTGGFIGGLICNEAWIQTMNGVDIDSEVGNKVKTEDDFARVCTSVPIKICSEREEVVIISAPSGYTSYQWFDYQTGQAIVGATSQNYKVTKAGIYSVRVNGISCITNTCCPICVEEFCECPPTICLPFIIQKTKSRVK